MVKWTAEGAVKWFELSGQSILQREERVSFRGYGCILQSAWLKAMKTRWHRG